MLSSSAPRRDLFKLLRQFAQYVMVGGLAFLVDFAALYGLTEWAGLHYLVSATGGFLLGLAVNYLLCIAWIFDHRSLANGFHEFTIFGLIGVAGLVFNNILMYSLTEGLGFHYLLSKVLAAACVLVFNFSLRRHLLFSDSRYARWLQGRYTSQENSS